MVVLAILGVGGVQCVGFLPGFLSWLAFRGGHGASVAVRFLRKGGQADCTVVWGGLLSLWAYCRCVGGRRFVGGPFLRHPDDGLEPGRRESHAEDLGHPSTLCVGAMRLFLSENSCFLSSPGVSGVVFDRAGGLVALGACGGSAGLCRADVVF